MSVIPFPARPGIEKQFLVWSFWCATGTFLGHAHAFVARSRPVGQVLSCAQLFSRLSGRHKACLGMLGSRRTQPRCQAKLFVDACQAMRRLRQTSRSQRQHKDTPTFVSSLRWLTLGIGACCLAHQVALGASVCGRPPPNARGGPQADIRNGVPRPRRHKQRAVARPVVALDIIAHTSHARPARLARPVPSCY